MKNLAMASLVVAAVSLLVSVFCAATGGNVIWGATARPLLLLSGVALGFAANFSLMELANRK